MIMCLSRWAYIDQDRTWHIFGKSCWIWMDQRPHYCDRGNWLARLECTDREFAREIDWQDGWPRYYMDLDRAKLEIEDWMKKRGQWKA